MSEALTLDAYMHLLKPDWIVAIGAASSYIFIGNKEQYEAEIDKIYEKMQRNARYSLQEANNILYALKRDGIKPVNVEVFIPDSDDAITVKNALGSWRIDAGRIMRFGKNLLTFADKYESAIKQKMRAESILMAPPFRERTVKEQHRSLTEKKIIVIIEGDEHGTLWSYDEAERRRADDTSKNTKYHAQG